MARKEITIGILDGGVEKSFRIRQMPVTKLEAWIAQTLLLVGNSEMDPALLSGGAATAGMASMGMKALANVSYEKAKPLYDELLSCCAVVIEGNFHDLSMDNADVHIEDVKTLFKLRMEAAKLNFDFFDFGGLSKLVMEKMTAANTTPTATSPA